MKYVRHFTFNAAHFNGAETYKNYHEAVKDKNFGLLHLVLCDQHGHNFKVIIQVVGPITDGMVIDDFLLEEVVMRWNNTNITLHKDFEKVMESNGRVTLELMVKFLKNLILEKFQLKPEWVKVRINETDLIYAEG